MIIDHEPRDVAARDALTFDVIFEITKLHLFGFLLHSRDAQWSHGQAADVD